MKGSSSSENGYCIVKAGAGGCGEAARWFEG